MIVRYLYMKVDTSNALKQITYQVCWLRRSFASASRCLRNRPTKSESQRRSRLSWPWRYRKQSHPTTLSAREHPPPPPFPSTLIIPLHVKTENLITPSTIVGIFWYVCTLKTLSGFLWKPRSLGAVPPPPPNERHPKRQMPRRHILVTKGES